MTNEQKAQMYGDLLNQHTRISNKISSIKGESIELNQEQLNAHIYLNYLALAYGGQMMKSKIAGSGRMYDFENMQECIGSIRAIQKDEWADEVNKGFYYIINILDELQRKIG